MKTNLKKWVNALIVIILCYNLSVLDVVYANEENDVTLEDNSSVTQESQIDNNDLNEIEYSENTTENTEEQSEQETTDEKATEITTDKVAEMLEEKTSEEIIEATTDDSFTDTFVIEDYYDYEYSEYDDVKDSYTVNGVTLPLAGYEIGMPHDNCWTFARDVYFKIWGSDKGKNMLEGLSSSELVITASNVKKYITKAELGSNIRLEDGKGNYQHSMILVDKDSDGFVVYHGNYNGAIYFTHYTYSDFASHYSNYKYFKYIVWLPTDTYRIKFETDGGTQISEQSIRWGDYVKEPDKPTKNGYIFKGWYTDKSKDKEYSFYTEVTENVTLYAKWEAETVSQINEEDKNNDVNDTPSISVNNDKTKIVTSTRVNNNVNDISLTIGSNIIRVGDIECEIDSAPYIQATSNSTLVPVRVIAFALSGNSDMSKSDDFSNIKWNSTSKTVTIYYDNTVIEFQVGSNIMIVNGSEMIMSNGVKAEITNGRLFVPFRALGEAFGIKVDWEADTKTAIYRKYS